MAEIGPNFSPSFSYALDDPAELPPTVAQGTVLDLDGAYPLAAITTLDPRQAMAETLACFILQAQFKRDGGNAADTVFRLERVLDEWPGPEVQLVYPCASIIDKGDIPYQAHNFTPTPLEETVELFCPNTVLWKTGEAVAEFQVDFWANDTNTRQAIAARLPGLFNPAENRPGVLLQGSPKYFDRRVRATMLDQKRIDDGDSVYVLERRSRHTIACEIDVVHLRQARPLQPRVQTSVDTS